MVAFISPFNLKTVYYATIHKNIFLNFWSTFLKIACKETCMYFRCRLSGITENFEDQILAIEAELNLRRTHNRCNFTIFRFQ